MPELNLKDIRKDLHWPELRLPEMSRDDIAKALGEARKELVEVRKDLNDFRRELEMPKVDLARVEMPRVDMADVANEVREAGRNVGKNIDKGAKQGAKQAAKAAQAVGLVKRPSRVPYVLAGIVTFGLVAWAVINSPDLKARVKSAAQGARERMAEARGTWDRDDETHAFDAAEPAGMAPSAFSDNLETTESPFAEPPSELPERFGKTNGSNTIEEDQPARA